MLKAGVLKSNYKFRVLSLDATGRQFLAMMELPVLHDGETDRLCEIENVIAQHALHQHEIQVMGVYWRVNEFVSNGLATGEPILSQPAALVGNLVNRPLNTGSNTPSPQDKRTPTLNANEMAAFKEAFDQNAKKLADPGEIVQSNERGGSQTQQFADTEIEDHQSPLSGIQYGSL